jgi:hypothetical protein
MGLKLLFCTTALVCTLTAGAQDTDKNVTVVPTGTVRTKFEYQPGERNGRFDVRTARFGIGGKIYNRLDYKMEIDLSDEGRMRMVDAYVGAKIYKGLNFNIGYMRVPFTIDAHRSPHLQSFANRSFIAKQMGSVRDVGASLGWKFGTRVPLNIQVGMFNGSGLPEDLQRYWTRTFNYSAKVQAWVLPSLTLVGGYQTTRPGNVRIHMFDAGATWRNGRWLVEGEYLRKNYMETAFAGANSVDAFVCYGIPLARGPFERISFLGRWDFMSDHSDGLPVDETSGWDDGLNRPLSLDDYARHRATAGVTFSLGLPFTADIRVNYEKYFYRTGAIIEPSDHDKIVVELMAHF